MVHCLVEVIKDFSQGCLMSVNGHRLQHLKTRTKDSGVALGEEKRPSTPLGSQHVAVLPWKFVQHPFEPEATKIIAHLSRGVWISAGCQKPRYQLPQASIG